MCRRVCPRRDQRQIAYSAASSKSVLSLFANSSCGRASTDAASRSHLLLRAFARRMILLLGDLPLLVMETSSSKSQRHRRSRATSTARLRGPPNETRQTTCTARRVAAQRVEDGGKHRQLLRLRAVPQEAAQAPLDDATCDSLIGVRLLCGTRVSRRQFSQERVC